MFIAISYTSVIHIHLYRCMQCSGYRELNRSRYLDEMYEPDIIQVQNRESKQWHYVRLAPMPTTRSLSSVPETQGAPQLDLEFQTLAVLHGRAPGEPLCHDQGVRWAAQRWLRRLSQLNILAYLGISWHILAYLGISWHILAYLGISWHHEGQTWSFWAVGLGWSWGKGSYGVVYCARHRTSHKCHLSGLIHLACMLLFILSFCRSKHKLWLYMIVHY